MQKPQSSEQQTRNFYVGLRFVQFLISGCVSIVLTLLSAYMAFTHVAPVNVAINAIFAAVMYLIALAQYIIYKATLNESVEEMLRDETSES